MADFEKNISYMTIGDKIPEVLGIDQDGREIKAADYRGRKIVLYSYPRPTPADAPPKPVRCRPIRRSWPPQATRSLV